MRINRTSNNKKYSIYSVYLFNKFHITPRSLRKGNHINLWFKRFKSSNGYYNNIMRHYYHTGYGRF